MSEEIIDKVFEAVEIAKATGKVKKGTNEVTKLIERGKAKLVVYAENVSPKEIVMHLPLLSKEKGVLCVGVPTKEELGAAAGLGVSTASIAVTEPGEAKAIIKEITALLEEKDKKPEPKPEEKPEAKPEKKEDKKPEPKPEEKPEAKPEKKEDKKPEPKPEEKKEKASE